MIVSVMLGSIEGGSAMHHISQGWSLTMVATVSGLNPTGAQDPAQVYEDALAAVSEIVGGRGSPCLSLSVPTYLEEFVPESISHHVVRVRIVWKGYPLPRFDFDGTLSQIETNLDRFGDPIYVAYHYPDNYILDPQGRVRNRTMVQTGLVPRPVPEPSFTIHFIVTSGIVPGPQTINGETTNYSSPVSALEYMSWLHNYEGTVNDDDYTIGLLTGTERTWMITRVRGSSKDGGFTYEASVTFQYRKAGWDPLVVFIDQFTGKPPKDLVSAADGGFIDNDTRSPTYGELVFGSYHPEIPDEATFPVFTYGGN